MASLADMSRGELEVLAAQMGITAPEGYPNMGALRDAIRERQEEPDVTATSQQEETVADDETTADDEQSTPNQQDAPASGDGGASQVQEMMDKEQEQGFVGRKVDPTPNDRYSMEGGAPEPGDNPTAPSEDEVKSNPRLGDQYEGQASHTPYEE
jgi:hypothetical protein